jgi:hypothetical protein
LFRLRGKLIKLKGIDIQFYEVYYNGEKKFFDIRKIL